MPWRRSPGPFNITYSGCAIPDAITYISCDTDGVLWKKTLETLLRPLDFRSFDRLGDRADIEVELAWKAHNINQ